jgi:hypothetical protein
MDKSKAKKKKGHQEPKLSFGSALKKNVKINVIIIIFLSNIVQKYKPKWPKKQKYGCC